MLLMHYNRINKHNFMKNLIKEMHYQIEMFNRWMKEQKLLLFSLNGYIYCQREIERESKCTYQCEHCKEYYKLLKKKYDCQQFVYAMLLLQNLVKNK